MDINYASLPACSMTIDKSVGNYNLSGNTWFRPSYGVLEVLRDTEVTARNGQRERLFDSVDVITRVSGGRFAALAHGLYGNRLVGARFDDRF